jgi:hypothetical protein
MCVAVRAGDVERDVVRGRPSVKTQLMRRVDLPDQLGGLIEILNVDAMDCRTSYDCGPQRIPDGRSRGG